MSSQIRLSISTATTRRYDQTSATAHIELEAAAKPTKESPDFGCIVAVADAGLE